ncbi:MOSC domain-containing protein [Mycobacterium sp. ML4]
MGKLVSVNVGMPKDARWNDRTVYTGIWKTPVDGPVMARRLNLDGDGQGDLGGHGGEQRAVLVYQIESYEYWTNYLGRDDLRPGHFGENFTVSGLADDEVCIGDRYRIGAAEFEVTQPRVTCFRVGMRLGEPRIPSLLVSQRRPGFYLRVITEGSVQAGDGIVLTRRGRHELNVADVDALLYLPDRDLEQLRKIVDVPELSPGWQQSFTEMLAAHDGATTSAETVPSGFRRLRVTATQHETPVVLSIWLTSEDGTPLPRPLPGQYLTVRIPSEVPQVRSYSLSGDPGAADYRISVKREEHGMVSRWLHRHIEPGAILEVAAPRGDFCLIDNDKPVLLISAGIGATPVLAMLHALSTASRGVWWLHTTRNRDSEAFAAEVNELIDVMPHATRRVFYTETHGRLDRRAVAALGLPTNGTAYLCGPTPFMADMRDVLTGLGFDSADIHSEVFGARPAINPGVVNAAARLPHQPPGAPGDGPAITFTRSGLTVNWSSRYSSILEIAEACDVSTRFSCRSGVCHVCVTSVVAGTTSYVQPPLELPEPDEVLICSAAPASDLMLDL